MSVSLAVKYRPKTLQEMVGQDYVVDILEQQCLTGNTRNCYLFKGLSGSGKAQPLTSKVLTPTGYVNMGDIQVGDCILDGKGNPTTVLGVFPQGVRPIYKITFSDRTSIEVSDEHLNSVYINNVEKHRREDFVLTTLELKEKIKTSPYKLRVDLPVIDCWKDENIDIDPYLLGCLIGDGSLSNNFGFSNNEEDVIEKVDSLLQVGWGMCLKKVPGDNVDYSLVEMNKSKHKYTFEYGGENFYSIDAIVLKLISQGYPKFDGQTIVNMCKGNSNRLKDFPELRGKISVTVDDNYRDSTQIHPLRKSLIDKHLLCKSCDKRIPTNYLYASFETRLKLLQGLFDTDGYVGSNFSYTLTTSSDGLAKDIDFLVRSLGIQCTTVKDENVMYTYKGEKRKGKDSYTFNLHPSNRFKIFTSKKHEARYNLKQQEPMRKVVSVDYVRDDVCQCIYVASEEHTYLTDNITVTHNTTAGRAFAMKLNNGQGTPIEIDAASNNGVDNIREIIKSANERALDSKYKVIILDEAHALSNAAWQAMLKCIEEPPKYTIFIFCTTDAQKIPATILNRVQVFNFTRIPLDKIKSRLKYICDCEGFTNYEEGIDYIAKLANGGMRDAITYLDKCSTFSKEITINNVLTCLGNFSYDAMFNIVNSIIDGEQGKVMGYVQEIIDQGADMKLFADQFLSFLLDVLKFILYKDFRNILIPEYYKDPLIYTTSFENCEKYFSYLVDRTLSMKNMLKNDTSPAVTTQVCFSQMTRGC